MNKIIRYMTAMCLTLALCAGLLSGCGWSGRKTDAGTGTGAEGASMSQERSPQTESGSPDLGGENTFKIVTSFYPLYIMMMNLTDGVENVQLANMAEPQTGCLHDYQLRPKDLVSLEGANLFLANGGGMEEFLSDVLDTYPELTVVYALDGLHEEDLLPGEEHAHDGHDHAHGEAETGAGNIHTESAGNAVEVSGAGEAFQEEVDEAEGHFGELTSGVVNPHTWLDPSLYIEEIRYISSVLGEMDPENRERYEENCASYIGKIDQLTAEYEDLTEAEPKKGCVLLHESFAYLASAYGFPVMETVDVEKDSGFSAREIRQLIDLVREAGDVMIISDSQYSGRISGLLAEETGLATYQMDSGVSGEYEKDAWLDAMRGNLETLRTASEMTSGSAAASEKPADSETRSREE